MVNINIQIPDDIHKRVKIAAVQADCTIKEYIIEQLGNELRRRRE